MNPGLSYLEQAQAILDRVLETQLEAIRQAAEICADTIAREGLVYLFATGHSRMFIEEMYPRHGSFPGFFPIVELSLTYHNPVVGPNGQRQAMFLEHVEGFGAVIMRNFVFSEPDCFLIFSNSGVNEVVVEVALEAKQRGLPIIAVVSGDHCAASSPQHRSGRKLPDVADITIDNCSPAGDAMVQIEGLEDPVGPGSTIGAAAVTNMLKVEIAARLVKRGVHPLVLTSSYFVGTEASKRKFEDSYDDFRRRIRRAYGG